MDVEGPRPWLEDHHILLHFTDAQDGRLQNLFDKYPLLWVDYLIIALLLLPVDVNVFYV